MHTDEIDLPNPTANENDYQVSCCDFECVIIPLFDQYEIGYRKRVPYQVDSNENTVLSVDWTDFIFEIFSIDLVQLVFQENDRTSENKD